MQSNNDDGYDDGCIGSDNNSCVPSGHHHDGDHLVTVGASLGHLISSALSSAISAAITGPLNMMKLIGMMMIMMVMILIHILRKIIAKERMMVRHDICHKHHKQRLCKIISTRVNMLV